MTGEPQRGHRPIDDEELVEEPVGQPTHDLPGDGPGGDVSPDFDEEAAKRAGMERRRRELRG